MDKTNSPTKSPRREGRYMPPSPEAVRSLIAEGPWKSRPEMHKTIEGRRIENWASIFRIPVAALLREIHGPRQREGYAVLYGDKLREAIAKGPWKTRAEMRNSARGRQLDRWASQQKVPVYPILRSVHGPRVSQRRWTVETVTAAVLAGPWASRTEMIASVEGRRISNAATVLHVKIAPLLAQRGRPTAAHDDNAADAKLKYRTNAKRGVAKGLPANCWLFGSVA